MGAWTGIPLFRHAFVALAVFVALMLAASAAQAATSVGLSIPAHYIGSYPARAKKCSNLITPPWIKWLSYANVTVSDEWIVTTSNTKLCRMARTTADAVIFDARFDDGANNNLNNLISYARYLHKPSSRRAPKPAGASWKCTLLPSFWGQQAWDLAHGFPSDQALAAASGAAAGAGFCETGAKQKNGKLTGGAFFSWAPDTTTCQRHYTLKSIPDPTDPSSTTNPPFPANLFDDYDQVGC